MDSTSTRDGIGTGDASFAGARILIVDDQPLNVMRLKTLLGHWGATHVVGTTDPSETLSLFRRVTPDLVVLDLNMPPPDGFALLAALEPLVGEPVPVPIVVVTADLTPDSRRRALAMGASDFLTKPFDPVEVRLRVGGLLNTRRLELQLQDQNQALEERVKERTRELEQARTEAIERLALAAEYRDDDTHEHAQRVGRTAALIAERLGLEAERVELIRRAAPLHDVGKLAVPDAILLKRGELSDPERGLMQDHTTAGGELLASSDSRLLAAAREIALTHHERWDGHGYPAGLAGEQIPLAGRIVALADVFDALTHERPYKRAWSLGDALAELRASVGEHFDPGVVGAFEALDHEALLTPVRGERFRKLSAAQPTSAGHTGRAWGLPISSR